MKLKLKVDSCLLDEAANISHLEVDLTKNGQVVKTVNFRVRQLLDSERAKARQIATTGESVVTYEPTPEAIQRYAEKKQKAVSELTRDEINEAAREYGPKSFTSALNVEKFNIALVYFALGGEKKLSDEGWDLTDKDGKPLPVTMEALSNRLNPAIIDALVELIVETGKVELPEGERKNF